MSNNRKILNTLFDDEWSIEPAGGMTGEAYVAKSKDQSLFVKFNSSPILAVLSVEGIVPKLVWTKRLLSGEVLSAQVWLQGEKLEPSDMCSKQVAQLLRKIHTSEELGAHVDRMGMNPLDPIEILATLQQNMPDYDGTSPIVHRALQYLEFNVTKLPHNCRTICHCDINHNNFIHDEYNQLYLVDWDDAILADFAIDVGPLLFQYVEQKQWRNWLEEYGTTLDTELFNRLKWYAIAQALLTFLWFDEENQIQEKLYWEQMIKKGLDTVPL
ncbi:MAG: phosphotransferase [Bacilli bacterium]